MIWLLRHVPRSQNGQQSLHIGFSGLLNLDIMAERDSKLGVLLDRNTRTIETFKLLDEVLHDPEVTDRVKFVQEFTNRLSQMQSYFMSRDELLRFIEGHLNNRDGWLASDKKFGHIRRMFLENRVAFFRLDIRDVEKFKKISAWIQENGVTTDTVYISSIYEWIRDDEGRRQFAESIAQVINGQTILLETTNATIPSVTLAYRDQRIDGAIAASSPGGIDLNSSILELQSSGKMIEVNLSVNTQSFQNLQIEGFVPVIFQIVPTTNLQLLLGESSEIPQQQLSSLKSN